MQDIPFPVNSSCATTADTAIGGLCPPTRPLTRPCLARSRTSSARIVEIGQLQINDGGTDGQVATTDNTLFEVQGIFIP